jgi:8-oxo-dGTP pyrophosphatase MutT (NUDIX family)
MKLITDAAAARAVVPRPAATTLVVRNGEGDLKAPLEVLMVRRSPAASFMPGAYVFPGGAVDAADALADGEPGDRTGADESAADAARRIGEPTQVGAQAQAFAIAALRECFEECGLWLGADAVDATAARALRSRLHGGEAFAALAREAGWRLHTSVLAPWSHWVTPLGLAKRFDTLFFVARAPRGQTASVDAGETTTLAWVQPSAALDARARGEFPMEFATVRTVQSLRPFATIEALFAHAATLAQLPPLHPRLRLEGGGHDGRSGVTILLPGDPGYDGPDTLR